LSEWERNIVEETKYSCDFIEFGDGVLTPRLVGDDPAFEFGADIGNHVTDSTGLGVGAGSAVTGFGVDPSDGDGVSMTESMTGLMVGDVGFLVEGRGVDRIVGGRVDGVSIGASDGLSVGAVEDWIWLFRYTRIVCLSRSNEEHAVIPNITRQRLTSKQINDTHIGVRLGRSARELIHG
jgi:hypothetical protein